jgi:hypothetical protein
MPTDCLDLGFGRVLPHFLPPRQVSFLLRVFGLNFRVQLVSSTFS